VAIECLSFDIFHLLANCFWSSVLRLCVARVVFNVMLFNSGVANVHHHTVGPESSEGSECDLDLSGSRSTETTSYLAGRILQ